CSTMALEIVFSALACRSVLKFPRCRYQGPACRTPPAQNAHVPEFRSSAQASAAHTLVRPVPGLNDKPTVYVFSPQLAETEQAFGSADSARHKDCRAHAPTAPLLHGRIARSSRVLFESQGRFQNPRPYKAPSFMI